MYITYLDESGCTGVLPSATSPIQPVLSILCITVRCDQVPALTRDFLALKRRFFPSSTPSPYPLNAILDEVKGGDFRREFRTGNRTQVRHHLLFLERLLTLLQTYNAVLFGRIYVKPIAGRFDGTPVYTSAVQSLCHAFQHYLISNNTPGIIIADSRYPGLNAQVSHSVFTEKFRVQGDKYPNLLEMPLFGHSENHAGIQICDLINSAIVFPLACHVYCTGFVNNVHVHPNYQILKTWFGQRLRLLQFRFQDPVDNRWKGGLTVADPHAHRSSADLF
jgi:Protein of unknown function (DUF3800)